MLHSRLRTAWDLFLGTRGGWMCDAVGIECESNKRSHQISWSVWGVN